MSIAPPVPGRATARRSYRPARITGAYLLFGAAWLGLTGARGDGFVPAIGPDAVFVALSALLVYRLARRAPPGDVLLRAVAGGATGAEPALDGTQRRLREALRVARLGNWSWDEGTGRVQLSDECREVFGPGAAAEALDFEQFLALIHPDDRPAVAERFAAARAGAEWFATDLRAARAGRVQWVHCQARAVRGADGRLERLDGLVQDISDRAQAAERLRDRERLLAIVTSAAQVGLVVVGDRYEYLFANDAYAEMLGFPSDGIVGRQVWDLLPDGWAQIRPRLERALAGERVSYEIDLPVPGAPGLHTFRVMYEPRPKDGRPTVVVVLVDVTEQKQAEAAIRESEARFRTLVSALPDAVYINSGGRAVYCNPACVRLFGADDAGALVGKTPFELMHPDDHAVIRARIAAITSTGAANPEIEERIVRIDGAPVPVLVTAIAITDRGERAFLVVLRDLTERKRVEQQLRYQELLIREAAELAHVGGWGFDPVTQVSDWTPVVAAIHDLPPDAPTPEPARGIEFYVEEDRPRIAAAVRAAAETGATYDLELRMVSARGVRKWVRAIGRPIVEGGRVVRVRGSFQDITDRKRAEAEIRELNAELEQRVRDRTAELEAANAELEAFSYSVSHDLRAPLRAIDGFSRIVRDDYGEQLPAEAREFLSDVCANTARMGRLVDDLLTFSRLGRQPVRRQTVNTNGLVASCLTEVLKQIPDAGRVETRITELPPCEADPALLRQVWLNLLSNALKYTGKRDPAVVEVGAEPSQNGPAYFVRDNGVGFDMRYAHKLFGVFQRLHRAEEYAGTGIGLALVQRIVSRHGGRVWAEAEPDKGATFSFTLGRAPAPRAARPGDSTTEGLRHERDPAT